MKKEKKKIEKIFLDARFGFVDLLRILFPVQIRVRLLMIYIFISVLVFTWTKQF